MTVSVPLARDERKMAHEQGEQQTELEVLSSLLTDPGDGRAGLVLRGEPSALLDELVARAPGHGLRVLRARGVEAEAELPFSGVHQLLYPLRRHISRLPDAQREALERAFGLTDGPEPSRFVISAGALALIDAAATAEGPLLLLVDDGIDRASAEVLGFVARRLSGQPVLFLATVAGDDSGPLTAGLPELRVDRTPVWPQAPTEPWAADRTPTGLTTQELRIARLAAQGLTNKQIGEKLFLSHRTVGTHLYKLFPKLGVSSRAALRDALSRQPV